MCCELEAPSDQQVHQISCLLSPSIAEHGIYHEYTRPDFTARGCYITAHHSIFLYHNHHHPRISHIVSSAFIASIPASVVSCYSFFPSILAHHLVRSTRRGTPSVALHHIKSRHTLRHQLTLIVGKKLRISEKLFSRLG